MANPDIGMITCPITGEKDCPVRRYSTGKKSLYFVSQAGKITPNLPAGQAWMKANTRFFGDNDKPLEPVNGKKAGIEPVTENEPVNDSEKNEGGFLGWLNS